MKKKSLQLSKKLVLQKNNIVPLSSSQLGEMLGGNSEAVCVVRTIQENCHIPVYSQSACLHCATQNIKVCISYRITPGC